MWLKLYSFVVKLVFSCEDAALQVLMSVSKLKPWNNNVMQMNSVCVSVCVWPMLKFYLFTGIYNIPKVTQAYPKGYP